MDQSDPQEAEHPEIESAMQAALQGSRDAARTFYEALFEGPLYVPDRHQRLPLSDAPQYPNDLVHILGVQAPDRVVVPVFTNSAYVTSWCGAELEVKSFKGQQLFRTVPEDWWIVLNPGQDVEKEISPWEIGVLRPGPEGIDEVLDDLFAREVIDPLTVAPVEADDYKALQSGLLEIAPKVEGLDKIFLLKEHGRDIDGEEVTQILVGLQIDPKKPERLEPIRDELKQVIDRAQIGDDQAKILIGIDAEQGVALGVFKGVEPIYSR